MRAQAALAASSAGAGSASSSHPAGVSATSLPSQPYACIVVFVHFKNGLSIRAVSPCRTMASFFLPVLPATAGSAPAAPAAYTAAAPPPAASPPLTSKKRKRAPKTKAASASSAVKWTSEELDLLDELQTEYERLENKPKARWIWTADQWKTRMALDSSGLNIRGADQLKTRAQTNGRKAGGQSARKKQRTGAGSASSAIDEENSDADM
jgi:hypothetical protein